MDTLLDIIGTVIMILIGAILTVAASTLIGAALIITGTAAVVVAHRVKEMLTQ